MTFQSSSLCPFIHTSTGAVFRFCPSYPPVVTVSFIMYFVDVKLYFVALIFILLMTLSILSGFEYWIDNLS